MVIAFNSCKPKQSTYYAAYELALQRPGSTTVDDFSDDEFADETDLAPVSKPRSEVGSLGVGSGNIVDIDESLNYATRQEQINPYPPYEDTGSNSYIAPANLKRYNVVIGSFRNKTNANALRERMQYEGYSATLAQNELGMIRVIISSSDSKSEAIRARDKFRSKHYPNFQDTWILEQRY
jgi:hypothetical protein